jgi:hypothetical protein
MKLNFEKIFEKVPFFRFYGPGLEIFHTYEEKIGQHFTVADCMFQILKQYNRTLFLK